MNKDQEKVVDLLLELQKHITTTSFAKDTNSFATITYHFDHLVDGVRLSLGNQVIKEYLAK